MMCIRIQLKRKEALFIGLFPGKQESRNNNITLTEKFNIIEKHLYHHYTDINIQQIIKIIFFYLVTLM